VRKLFQPIILDVTIQLDEIHGGETLDEAANIFMDIIQGKGSEAQNNVVLANAALAIQTHQNIEISEAMEKAKASLFGLKALQSFNALKQLS
jgi:anthranilate phosphoribosyltransferase